MSLLEKAKAHKLQGRRSDFASAELRELALAALTGEITPTQLSVGLGRSSKGSDLTSSQATAFRVLRQMYVAGLIRIDEASASPVVIHARKRA